MYTYMHIHTRAHTHTLTHTLPPPLTPPLMPAHRHPHIPVQVRQCSARWAPHSCPVSRSAAWYCPWCGGRSRCLWRWWWLCRRCARELGRPPCRFWLPGERSATRWRRCDQDWYLRLDSGTQRWAGQSSPGNESSVRGRRIAVISIGLHLTDNGEHTVLYRINKKSAHQNLKNNHSILVRACLCMHTRTHTRTHMYTLTHTRTLMHTHTTHTPHTYTHAHTRR